MLLIGGWVYYRFHLEIGRSMVRVKRHSTKPCTIIHSLESKMMTDDDATGALSVFMNVNEVDKLLREFEEIMVSVCQP